MSLDIKVFFHDVTFRACFHRAVQILEIYGMSEISGPQTGNSYDKVRGHYESESDYYVCFLQLKPGTIGKDLEGFHSRLDKSAPGAAEVIVQCSTSSFKH